MKKKQIGLDVLGLGIKFLGYTKQEKVGVMTLKDGSKITTHFAEFKTPEGPVLINLSGTKTTLEFEDEQEAERFYKERVELFENDKEMHMKHFGITEETWEEWNK